MLKKIFAFALTIIGGFILTGCDFGGETGITNLRYDDMNEMISISYSIDKPSVDDDTGVRPEEIIYIEASHRDYEEWFEVAVLDNYSADDLQIQYRFDNFGEFELRVVARSPEGVIKRETESEWIYINQPQYIHHFDAYFDNWSGEVRFNFDINVQVVDSLQIEKSVDGGLTWSEVITLGVEVDEFGFFMNEISIYEFDEGNYVYRLNVFDQNESLLDEMNTWGEIGVYFEQQSFDGPAEIWYVDANVDTYSQMVNVWWDCSGDFDAAVVEKSTDLITWTQIGEVPRIAQTLSYQELDDGEYYYRVSVTKDGVIESSIVSDNTTRVKTGALIGYLDGWIDWETQSVNLNWEFPSEQVSSVQIERKWNDGDFELLGDFGNLKKLHYDEGLAAGTYYYKVIVLDENGIELDSFISDEFYIEAPNYVYHLSANYNWGSGDIMFYLGMDYNYVDHIVIEKSSDGGSTWDPVIELDVEYEGMQDNISYYEYEEGAYTFRLIGYDELDQNIGEVYLDYEIDINYENLNLDLEVEIHNVDTSSDIYSQNVNIWWYSQGSYHKHVIEKSTDLLNWELVTELPRAAQSYYYYEGTEGDFYYRVSLVSDTDEVLESNITDYSIRVKINALIGSIDGWFDWNESSFNLNWSVMNEDVETIVIERKFGDEEEFTVIGEFGNLKSMFSEVIILSGTYTYKISVLDSNDNVLDFLETQPYEIEVPQHVYHLSAWFDQGTGKVEIHFGINQNRVVSYLIEKSDDGGLTWVEIITNDVEMFSDGWYNDHEEFYELVEGNYVYRMTGYDIEGNNIGTTFSNNEITVRYDNIDEEGEAEMHFIDAHINIHNQDLSLSWGSQGAYVTHLIEKSTDLINWELVALVPRQATFYNYTETIEGEYYFRISAVGGDDLVLDSVVMDYPIRVKEDALIGSFNAWYEWSREEVELYWDIIDEGIEIIKVERKLVDDAEFTLVGEYGHLKRVLFDPHTVDGTYIYKLTLLDIDGNVLDEVESFEVLVDVTD